MKAKDKTLARFQCRRTLRLTGEEDARLSGQAAIAGISRFPNTCAACSLGADRLSPRRTADHPGVAATWRLAQIPILKRSGKKAGRNELAELSATLNAIRAVIERLSER